MTKGLIDRIAALNEIAEYLCDTLQDPSHYRNGIVYAKQVAETALSKIEGERK